MSLSRSGFQLAAAQIVQINQEQSLSSQVQWHLFLKTIGKQNTFFGVDDCTDLPE